MKSSSAEAGMPVTVSIGVATCPADGETLSTLFANADTRLYDAKYAGRNRVVGRSDTAPRDARTNSKRSKQGAA